MENVCVYVLPIRMASVKWVGGCQGKQVDEGKGVKGIKY